MQHTRIEMDPALALGELPHTEIPLRLSDLPPNL